MVTAPPSTAERFRFAGPFVRSKPVSTLLPPWSPRRRGRAGSLRRLVDATTVVANGQRRTVGEAGDAYIAHLEHVMERKRTTIADYRGCLRRHLARSSATGRWTGSTPHRSSATCTPSAARTGPPRPSRTISTSCTGSSRSLCGAAGQRRTRSPSSSDRGHTRSAHRRIRFLHTEELEAVIRAVPADALGTVERPYHAAIMRERCRRRGG
jgi:hypothetical protein